MSYTGQNPRFRSTILTDIGLASIGNPASGSHRIINRGGTLQVQDSTGLETAIGAGGTVDRITQVGHGFVEGEILYNTGSAYAKANANTSPTAEALGMVSRVIDANTFELTLEGKVTGLTGLTAGAVYFLSASTAGAITVTEPSTLGYVSLPIGVAISTTAFYVKSSRGAVVGSTNARTEIALANNATTNVQSVAAYQAGELTGWVEIDGTTDSKFYVAAPFAKKGDGTDYNISPQYVGDTPPVGFLMTVTSGGLIQVTLPNVAGFLSAKINFSLNAPAVGATFPLSIDSTAVQFSTLKAKDSGGFVFQENGGTQIGSWSDSGAIDIGPTSGTLVHKLRAGNTDVQIIGSSGSSNQVLDFIANGVSTFNIASGPGIGSTWFRTNNSSVIAAQVSTASAWIFGATGFSSPHTFNTNRIDLTLPSTGGAINYSANGQSWHIGNIGSSAGSPGGTNSVYFYNNTSGTFAGGISTGGSFTLGNPTITASHILNNNQTNWNTIFRNHSNGSVPYGLLIQYPSATPNDASGKFIECVDSTQARFRVFNNGNVTNVNNSYGALSDISLKENIVDATPKLDDLLSVKIRSFNLISDGEGKKQIGVIAQELEEIFPSLVEAGDDGLKGVKYSVFVPILIKAIQELSAKVTALENKGI